MRLRKHAAAWALCCAAAGAGAPTAALGHDSPDARAPAASAAPRPVDVTPRTPDAPVVELKVDPFVVGVDIPDAPAVRVGERVPFLFAQSAPDQPAQPGNAPGPNEQQRVVELYRAHFGGQLTKASYLGVSTSAVPAALRQHLGLQEGVGLVVDFVEPDSPAASAGIKQYDILTKFNDQILVNAQQLAVLVRAQKAGDEVKLALIRGGKEQSLTAKLVEKEVKPLEDISFWADPNAFAAKADDLRLANRRQAAAALLRDAARQQNNRNPNPNSNRNSSNRSSNRTMSVWRDNDMTLTISRVNDGGRRLVVTDKSGKALHDVDLDNPEDRKKLPPHVAEKVRQMETKEAPADTPKPPEPRGSADFNSDDVEVQLDASVGFSGSEDEASDKDSETEEREDKEIDLRTDGDEPEKPRASIGNNDLLNIAMADVHGHGVKTVKVARVRDGQIHLPYVAPVKCLGLTENELERRIRSVYAEAKVAPKVNVRVRKVDAADREKK